VLFVVFVARGLFDARRLFFVVVLGFLRRRFLDGGFALGNRAFVKVLVRLLGRRFLGRRLVVQEFNFVVGAFFRGRLHGRRLVVQEFDLIVDVVVFRFLGRLFRRRLGFVEELDLVVHVFVFI